MLYFQALLLALCIQLNLRCNNHWPAVITFVVMSFLVQLAITLSLGLSLLAVLITTSVNFVFAFLYFFSLGRTQGSSYYWPIMAAGLGLYIGIWYFI
ncbi:hypothetical protein IEN85_16605 [Pelagicoccus sp. NFK12]|uniref:Uncharacterized protein n=1 Tax=Pelagicoccus enzymogenes TaxID=2773457 RepID=A0A927IGE8_9BACT|nr:hypothetical protein [Pelagicoccus enzymogenes]MBD5781122.1 hypothetical protein [Pelagicoccus enzymogenes]MDQ8199828.1 hypothetical protein [Pelagicoccus enzymogenes]